MKWLIKKTQRKKEALKNDCKQAYLLKVLQLNNLFTLLVNSYYIIARPQYCGHKAPITIGRPLAHGPPPESEPESDQPRPAHSHSVGVVIHNLSESHKNNKYFFCYRAFRTSVLCLVIFSIWCETLSETIPTKYGFAKEIDFVANNSG